jgi:hypothetical protein
VEPGTIARRVEHPPLRHVDNWTWLNERAVEIPLAAAVLDVWDVPYDWLLYTARAVVVAELVR